MDFLSDVELVRAARIDNPRALPVLLERHQLLLRRCMRPWYLPGADDDDLKQEAALGLTKAVRDYNTASGVPFHSFAELVVTRHLISTVQSYTRQRHRVLNESARFAMVQGDDSEGGGETLGDRVAAPEWEDPARAAVARERMRELCQFLDQGLTETEATVLDFVLEGRGFEEIAMRLGYRGGRLKTGVKMVDNTFQRVRRKVAGKGWAVAA